MKLIKIWESDLNKAYKLQASFKEDENGFCNHVYGCSFDEFKEYVLRCQEHSQGINLQEGFVPDTIYILVDDENNYVGIFNLRHFLNDFLEKGPGHIGYGISEIYRGKGYGTKGLALTLKEAKKLDIDLVYMSANIDNKASIKVQLNNGAFIDHQDDKCVYTRIKL